MTSGADTVCWGEGEGPSGIDGKRRGPSDPMTLMGGENLKIMQKAQQEGEEVGGRDCATHAPGGNIDQTESSDGDTKL